jgi:hypothetical protein
MKPDFVLCKLAGVLVQFYILSCRGRRLRQGVSASGSVLDVKINGIWIMTSHILTSESPMVVVHKPKAPSGPMAVSSACVPSRFAFAAALDRDVLETTER